jgi:WD40 repeat protein
MIYAVAVTPDASAVVSAHADGSVQTWDPASGRLLRSMEGHTNVASAVAVTPDGRLIASGSWDHSVRVWELATGRLVRVFGYGLQQNGCPIHSIALSADGEQVFTGTGNGVRVWGLDGQLRASLPLSTRSVPCMLVSPAGDTLLAGLEEGSISVWDLPEGRQRYSLEGHTSKVTGMSFLPDLRHFVSGSWDGSLRLWDLASGCQVAALETKDFAWGVAGLGATRDGEAVVYASRDGWIRHWNLRTQAVTNLFVLPAVTAVALSPDDRWLVCGDQSGGTWILNWVRQTAEGGSSRP